MVVINCVCQVVPLQSELFLEAHGCTLLSITGLLLQSVWARCVVNRLQWDNGVSSKPAASHTALCVGGRHNGSEKEPLFDALGASRFTEACGYKVCGPTRDCEHTGVRVVFCLIMEAVKWEQWFALGATVEVIVCIVVDVQGRFSARIPATFRHVNLFNGRHPEQICSRIHTDRHTQTHRPHHQGPARSKAMMYTAGVLMTMNCTHTHTHSQCLWQTKK